MKLEQQIREIIQQRVNALERDYQCRNIEWYFIQKPIQDVLIEPLVGLILHLVKEKEDTINELTAKLNQSTFVSNPDRDKEILKLHRQGLNNSEIGRRAGMSRQGVAKALHRLGIGNSVDIDQRGG